MRFISTVPYIGLSSKSDTLIDKASSFNFVSKEFVMAYVFQKYCMTVPKLSIRGASEHRIFTTQMFVLWFLPLMDTNSPT